MKSIKTKPSTHKKLLYASGILVAAVLTVLTYMYFTNSGLFSNTASSEQNSDSIDYQEPSDEQLEAGKETKESTIKTESTPADGKPNETSASNTDSSGDSIGVIINEPNVSGSTLSVRTVIQDVSSSGTCTLTLSKAGQSSIVKTAATQVSGSVSTCKGFTFDVGSRTGTWKITLGYSSKSGAGSASRSVSL